MAAFTTLKERAERREKAKRRIKEVCDLVEEGVYIEMKGVRC